MTPLVKTLAHGCRLLLTEAVHTHGYTKEPVGLTSPLKDSGGVIWNNDWGLWLAGHGCMSAMRGNWSVGKS